MTVQFTWKPSNNPVASESTNRVDIALELGGDDAKIADPSDGRIKILELTDTGSEKGKAENPQPRLIATLHGKFHRNTKAPMDSRITFEIKKDGATDPYIGNSALGFDPECIRGIDAFVVTFLNREFVIPFPFMLDSFSEGNFLELQAIAETGSVASPTEAGKSDILHLRIRRKHEIETTTKMSSGAQKYTDFLIGNCILLHESYLTQGLSANIGASWPSSPVDAQIIPIKWSGSDAIPFEKYAGSSLQFILMNDLLDDIIPEAPYLLKNVAGVSDAAKMRSDIRKRLQSEMKKVLEEKFLDAGFAGATARWQDDAAVSTVVGDFTSLFKHQDVGGNLWILRDAKKPMEIPFWTFIITQDTLQKSVGVAGDFEISFDVEQGSKKYRLPHTSPIGSGKRRMKKPVGIKTTFFEPALTTDPVSLHEKKYASTKDFYTAADAMAASISLVVAHEVAHNLGLMHDVGIRNAGPYFEDDAKPTFDVMCSAVEESPFALDLKFSNQAKVIWMQAFGVKPTFDADYLKNKTWGSNWDTVSWGEREKRFFDKHRQDGIISPKLSLIDPTHPVPPNAKKLPAVQKGTYVSSD